MAGLLAALLEKQWDREHSVEILAMICEHPSLEHDDKQKADILFAKLQAGLPSQVFQNAVEKGKMKTMEDLVVDIFRLDGVSRESA